MNGDRRGIGWMLGGGAVLVVVGAAGLAMALMLGPPDSTYRVMAAVAAGVCLGGSLGAWLLARLGDQLAATPLAGRHGLALALGLGAIALRLAPALVLLAWLQGSGAADVPGGVGRVLLGLYLSLLATDIVLTIMGRPGSAAGRGASRAN
jgi:hypothetical protein